MILLQKNLQKHFSLLILLTGAGGLYLANIMLYFILDTYDYSKYSLLSAYLSIVVVFSGFGFDQVLIRYAKVKENTISFSKNFIFPSVFLIFISSFILSMAFSIYLLDGWFLQLFIISILCGFVLYQFTILRLSSKFSEAQFLKNYWKVFFPIIACLIYFFVVLNLYVIVYILMSLMIVSVGIGYFYTSKINVEIQNGDLFDWKLLFGYFSATIIMIYISTSDRFIIDMILDDKDLALYFLIQNFFLFPFTQLQNYFGFKDVVAFKVLINMKSIRGKVFRNLKVSLLLSLFLVVLAFFSTIIIEGDNSEIIKENYTLILIFLVTGIIRVIYSSLSSAMSVFANYRTINFINIFTFIFISICTYCFFYIEHNLVAVALLFFLFWLQRSTLFYLQLKRGLNEV